jgi:hypothetical protein
VPEWESKAAECDDAAGRKQTGCGPRTYAAGLCERARIPGAAAYGSQEVPLTKSNIRMMAMGTYIVPKISNVSNMAEDLS